MFDAILMRPHTGFIPGFVYVVILVATPRIMKLIWVSAWLQLQSNT